MIRFVLEKSQDLPGWWVLTDTENMVAIRFKENDFNNSQKVTILGEKQEVLDKLGVNGLARVLREMADYLSINHYNTAMQPIKNEKE